MHSTGMIFQFNRSEGTGLIMSSKGETKEFSVNGWIDTSSEPTVGLKVSYENNDKLVNIQALGADENIINAKDKEVESTAPSSVDEYVQHYKDEGYKLVRDTSIDEVRTAILRRFLEDGHGEIIISQSNCEISVKTLVNGKEVS